ncbi:cache domain-containing protein [Photobacterium chitinilyticum]|uniref:bifunctional diguanylate cyclase/phosphodiesterase n=1 Tax=Photobacterium chitinilyticum TaxID=2485123 RepID=UPI003D14C6CE
MDRISDEKLLRLIKVTPVIMVVIFTLIINLSVIYDNQTKAKQNIELLRTDIIERQRSLSKNQVQQAVNQIEYEKSHTIDTLKKTIRDRTNEAHTIASSIYQQNIDKPKSQISKLITDALRNIRFNDGRGYFFIYQMDGTNVMLPVLPKNENSSMWNFTDSRGKYAVREMLNIVDKKEEGFHRWWFVKNGSDSEEFEKIGFGKYFKPLGWLIGTGDYIIDVEHDIQEKLLEQLTNIRYGDNGFFIILDQSGTLLAHATPEYVGKNHLLAQDSMGNYFVKAMLDAGKSGGDYVQYLGPETPYTKGGTEKVSYVMNVPGWNWTVGTGWYVNELNDYIGQRQSQLAKQNKQELVKITLLSLSLTIFALFLSVFLSKVIARRFKTFQEKINSDFCELQATKNQMQYMALHDSLTALPNRVLLHDNISKGIERAKLNNKQLAVMFIDLDDFKKVNDLHGHTVGDQLLSAISHEFIKIVGPGDTVSRFGGDEFVFCFQELDSEHCARAKVEQIKQVFTKQFFIDGKWIFSSSSIGVAMYPADGQEPEELISKADIVLYKSKARHKGDVLFFDDSINARVLYDFTLEEQLRLALENNELSVVYQPQIDVLSGRIHGIEALCRWHNKELSHVSPIDFIAVAENIGMIHDIGWFVIKQACSDFKTLTASVPLPISLSINLSPKQLLQTNFAENITNEIRSSGIDTHNVTLEITENVLISDIIGVSPILEELRKRGFKLSLDDFGTGYSSLSYLSNLPINEIKIDRSFIDKLLTSRESESLVKAIIAIGQSCNMQIVAEGVETQEQYKRLSQYHCDIVQGYYFDKPLSINELSQKYMAIDKTSAQP